MKKVDLRIFLLLIMAILLVGCLRGETKITTMEEQIQQSVESNPKVGKLSGHGIPEYKYRIHDVSIRDGETFLQLIASKGLSVSDTYDLAIKRSSLIFEDFYKNDDFASLDGVHLLWYFPEVNMKGQIELTNILTIHLSRETASSVNWENFAKGNLAEIADYFWQGI
ncbi:MAG: hypothetical protein QM401_11395 [Bacillota bacterium]|nr:hypothetical protein [Bacillota bacterium]